MSHPLKMMESHVLCSAYQLVRIPRVFPIHSPSGDWPRRKPSVATGHSWLLRWSAEIGTICNAYILHLLLSPSLPPACACNPYGTASQQGGCSPITGQCECLPHVTGRDCGACEPGFYNLQSGRGCERWGAGCCGGKDAVLLFVCLFSIVIYGFLWVPRNGSLDFVQELFEFLTREAVLDSGIGATARAE